MKQNPFELLFSNRLMGILFLLFPAAMALGTFIETWYSTDTAKIWIYNARWFEVLIGLLMLNFLGNIFKYRLLRKEKWATLSPGEALGKTTFVEIVLGNQMSDDLVSSSRNHPIAFELGIDLLVASLLIGAVVL